MTNIIPLDQTVVPACDVPFVVYENIIKGTKGVPKVRAYKVGVAFLDIGMKRVVDTARETIEDAIIIYDHQKAGTDIPESTPDMFMESMVRSGVNAVILFPQAGPVTQYEWTKAAQARNLGVIVGGEMTHPRYMQGDLSNSKSKNYTQIFQDLGIDRPLTGYIRSFAPEDMYELAARMGVTNFVMPGNKPDQIRYFKALIEGCGLLDPSIVSPGLVEQGGLITLGAQAAGRYFHGVVGRALFRNDAEKRYNKVEEIHRAAIELTSQLS
jgi:orotidine-5'-phosphate decarboxylase